MTRRDIDLILVVALSLALVAVVLALPWARAARIVLGLPFLLFAPGYALVAALFPRRGDLEMLERLALGLALSLAVVPLIGLALNYSPWGLRLEPILAFVTLFVVLAAAAALLQRRRLPPDEAFALALEVRPPGWSRLRLADRLLVLALVLSLAGLGATAYFVATSRGSTEGFTEFYVLGEGGMAEGYPTTVRLGERAEVTLGVVNREGREATYRIVVRIDGESTDGFGGLVLADGERWQGRVSLVPARAGEAQRVEFLLYKDGGSEPYRTLYLFLDVESAEQGE